jgi:hypothetical protein
LSTGFSCGETAFEVKSIPGKNVFRSNAKQLPRHFSQKKKKLKRCSGEMSAFRPSNSLFILTDMTVRLKHVQDEFHFRELFYDFFGQ